MAKVIKYGSKDMKDLIKQVNEKFTDILDLDKAELEVISIKLRDMLNILVNYVKILQILSSRSCFSEENKALLRNYADKITTQFKLSQRVYTDADVFPDMKKYYQLQIEGKEDCPEMNKIKKTLIKKYKDVSENPIIQELVETAGNLKDYVACLAFLFMPSDEKMSQFSRYHPSKRDKEIKPCTRWNFIIEEHSFAPLKFAPELDFVQIFQDDETDENSIKSCGTALSHFYWKGCELGDIITSPNMDTKALSQMFIEAIGEYKKKLPQCKKAFKLIESAVSTLDKKFDTYYRNSVKSNNPTVFMEDFFCDLLANNKEDKSLALEFRMIVNEMKKMVNQMNMQNSGQAVALINLLDDLLAPSGQKN